MPENGNNPDGPETPVLVPTPENIKAQNLVLKDFSSARSVQQKSYNQLNGRNIIEAIDDWTKRWNGYIPEPSALLDADQSQMFLNWTRNQIIGYLSKVALSRPKTKIKAVNKKTNMADQKFSDVAKDLVDASSNAENGDARFLEDSLECTVKGTVIVYEGYRRDVQEMKLPDGFDMMTGTGKFKKEMRVLYDDCYQEIVPIEDFFIANPYQPQVQKQPFIIWRRITTKDEAEGEYGHYKNFKYVKAGEYTLLNDPTTFYRNQLVTELGKDQVEVIRYYNRSKNKHVVMINGIIIYDGPIPFKDGRYPFSKGIFEPYGNDFFYGAGFPQKIMGEQDLMNTFWNMMVDKTYGSLLPYGLTSDLDDIIEDDTLAVNKIRKVGDITKWKFDTLPGVSAGEQAMLQTVMKFAQENSGMAGGGSAVTPKGGKMNVRQVLLQQQDMQQKLGFSSSFMEDFERDRIELRLNHILQFYSIPKIEKITGKKGVEIEQMLYRDVRLSGVKLSDGRTGERIIKLVPKPATPDERKKLEDDMAVTEAMGDVTNTPTEVLAVSVDTFYDYNFDIQIIRASSFEKNAALDQAARMEFANWRLPLIQIAPADPSKIVGWVEESFDIDTEQFKAEQKPQQPDPGAPDPGGGPGNGKPGMMDQLKPSGLRTLDNNMGA